MSEPFSIIFCTIVHCIERLETPGFPKNEMLFTFHFDLGLLVFCQVAITTACILDSKWWLSLRHFAVVSSNFCCLYGVIGDGLVQSQFITVDNILRQLLKSSNRQCGLGFKDVGISCFSIVGLLSGTLHNVLHEKRYSPWGLLEWIGQVSHWEVKCNLTVKKFYYKAASWLLVSTENEETIGRVDASLGLNWGLNCGGRVRRACEPNDCFCCFCICVFLKRIYYPWLMKIKLYRAQLYPRSQPSKAFSHAWPAAMQIYWNKWYCLHL